MQQEDRQAALMLSLVSVNGQMQITKLIVPISFSIFNVRKHFQGEGDVERGLSW
jgi:hypothetical protein